MVIAVYLPLLLSAAFGAGTPLLARRLPPRSAIWLISTGAVTCALGLQITLALLAFTMVGQNPVVASVGGWKPDSMADVSPVRQPVAAAALVALLLLMVRLGWTLRRRAGAARRWRELAAELDGPTGELMVIDDPSMQAWAVPGHPGRIVVSTTLLRTLTAAERRAVIAHERDHLRHHHHVHSAAAHLAAAANPLLWRMPAAAELALERAADEAAARSCSRATVATALLRASTTSRGAMPVGVLGVATSQVVARVRALRQPAPRPGLWRVAVLLGLVALTVAAVVEAVRDTNLLLIAARTWRH